jgi:hypothetical protein
VGDLQTARAHPCSKRIWDDVVVIGGMSYDVNGNETAIQTVETVNAQGVIATFGLNTPRMSHTSTHLNDGHNLIVGGFAYPSSDPLGLDGTANDSTEFYIRP